MKRKDLVNGILKIVGGASGIAMGYDNGVVYCDRSQSKNPEKRNKLFFLRLKYPCYSTKIKVNFDEYKRRIQTFLKLNEVKEATVHLRYTSNSYSGKFYFIEIIFHNGKPWEKNTVLDYEFSSHPSISQPSTPKNEVVADENKVGDNLIVIDKHKLANLIRIALKSNPALYDDLLNNLLNMNDDFLVEIFKQTSK